MTIKDITKEIGEYIRDTLRNDSEFISILGISNPENHIFLTRPNNQHKSFKNPRIVIEPAPSDSEYWANTEFLVGAENFQVTAWVNSTPYDKIFDVNSRILQLFNGKTYIFKDGSNKFLNFGIFKTFNKDSFPDPDKDNTRQGNLLLTLNIGGTNK